MPDEVLPPPAPYATAADFVAMYGNVEAIELTQLEDPEATTANTTMIDMAIEQAQGELNAYYAVRYELPLSEPYPKATQIQTLVVARYRLDKYRRREDVRLEYESVLRQLEWLAKGQFLLTDALGTELPLRPATQQPTEPAVGAEHAIRYGRRDRPRIAADTTNPQDFYGEMLDRGIRIRR